MFKDIDIQAILPLVLSGLTFLAVMVIWIGLIEDRSAERRIKMLEQRRADMRSAMMAQGQKDNRLGDFAKKIVDKFKLAPGDEIKGTAKELLQAGYRNKDAIFIYTFARLMMPLAGLALGGALFYVLRLVEDTSSMLLAYTLMCGIVAGLLPSLFLRNKKQKRMSELLKSLPDGLDLFVICAEAGLSLDAAFERVSTELSDAHPDLSDEFGLTAIEIGFMPDRAKALQNFAERCPLSGIRALVSTLVQTERYGTPLAAAMRVLSAEMRNERMMKAEEKAARLPAIMTVPMILFILPPLFVVLIGPAIIGAMDAYK